MSGYIRTQHQTTGFCHKDAVFLDGKTDLVNNILTKFMLLSVKAELLKAYMCHLEINVKIINKIFS
jgi:hypothetical protein